MRAPRRAVKPGRYCPAGPRKKAARSSGLPLPWYVTEIALPERTTFGGRPGLPRRMGLAPAFLARALVATDLAPPAVRAARCRGEPAGRRRETAGGPRRTPNGEATAPRTGGAASTGAGGSSAGANA